MLLQIADVLSVSECAAICDALNDESLWRDGKITAGGAAKRAKNNRQANPDAPSVRGARAKIESSLRSNRVFSAAAQPAAFARILLSRYEAGMAYGDHVDAAYMDGVRADLSFTLFLNEPDDYAGGELIIDTAGQKDEVKLPAGALVLYPSTSIHRVAPVSNGSRLAAVGWIKSRVRSGEARAVLYELACAIEDATDEALRLRLNNIRNNLLRLFGE